MSKPIITVFGATGAQGGGLVRAIIGDSQRHFRVRAVTRKPDGEAARALAQAGADIVTADLDDVCSVHRALEGAYGAFMVTNFWEHLSPEKEISQAFNLAGAAAQAGIRHAIWSTLEDTREAFPADGSRMPVLQGKYNVPHFDAKGEANRFFKIQRVPTTYLYTSCYWENFIHFGLGPKRLADGALSITFPTGDSKIPWIAAEDIGRCAYALFVGGEAHLGKHIGISGDQLSGGEIADHLSVALGERVTYNALPPEAYRALGFPAADELGNMFQFKRDCEISYRSLRDVQRTRQLHPQTLSFKQWLAEHAARIPLD